MTRTAATTTEQNVVERQLAIESSLATTKQLQSIVVRAQITNIAALLPRNYFHRCSLSLSYSLALGLCACEWQTFCTMATKRTNSKAEQAEKERAKESEQGSRI